MLKLLKGSPRNRIVFLAVLGIAMAVLFVGFGLMGGSPRGVGAEPAAPRPGGFEMAVEDSRKVVGFVESYGQRIGEAEKRQAEKESELEGLKSEIKKQTARMALLAGELEAVRNAASPRAADRAATGFDLRAGATREVDAAPEPPAVPRLQKVTLPAAKREAELRARKDEVRIPAGSFAEATLLTGVYAPTEGGAHPIQMRLDLAWVGPNRSRVPIQGAFLVAKAQGDANSMRAVIQLDRLSYVRRDGQVIEVPVNGYVSDQDGVMGLSGQYVWRIREAATLASLTGATSAAADAAAQRETVTQLNPLGGSTSIVTGDIGKFALARGASRAADEVGKIITRRLDEIVPAIFVPNGKRLTVVLIDGVTLEGLQVGEVKNETSQSPYAGLDLDR